MSYLRKALFGAVIITLLLILTELLTRIIIGAPVVKEGWIRKRQELVYLKKDSLKPVIETAERFKEQKNVRYIGGMYADDLVNFKFFPNSEFPNIYIKEGQVVFNKAVTTDSYGWRTTTDKSGRAAKNTEAFFAGGSRAFGWGANDDETIPSVIQEKLPGVRVHNLGLPGDSPQFFLKATEVSEFSESKKTNKYFYYLFDFTMEFRVVDPFDFPWVLRSTYYELNNGKLTEYKDYDEAHPVRAWSYRKYAQSAFLKYLVKKIPRKLALSDCHTIAAIFLQSQKNILTRFEKSSFEVIFSFPGPNTKQIQDCLTEVGVPSTSILVKNEFKESYEYDQHPKPIYYRAVGEKIAELINERQRQNK